MSRKKDLLGTGSSFTRNVSARRAAIDASTSAPTDGAPPPLEVPPHLISLNPANPRSDLGDLTDLAGSMKDHGQKTAISIMSRFSYLEAYPDQEANLEAGTKYVVIDGSSRLAAAREAGLDTIKVMLDDTLGADPDELLESALVANIHRQDLEPLDEARALQQLLKVHGTQDALAKRLHRSQGWVSQRLALLTLTPELQEKLASGQESAKLLRSVGKKPAEQQQAALEKLKEKEREKQGARQKLQATPSGVSREGGHAAPTMEMRPADPSRQPSESFPGQRASGGDAESSPAADDRGAVMEAPSTADVVDEPAWAASIPWAEVDGRVLGDLLHRRLPAAQRRVIVKELLKDS